MRHFYSFILLAVLSGIAGTTAWAYSFVADGIYYNITSSTDLTVEVTYDVKYQQTSTYVGNVVIPATVENEGTTYSVTSIGNFAFDGCTGLTSIEIPSGVTGIGYNAFRNCSGLTSIEIPSGVTSIGESAFQSCTGLTSIEIPIGVTSIGESAFQSCTGLTSIVVSLDNSVYDSRNNCNAIIKTASNTLIKGCQNSFIPDGVTGIGNHAFSYCTGLTNIEIPSSVTSIGDWAFTSCKSLTSIEIPSGVTSIGGSAFGGCSGLTSIVIPSSVTSIGEEAFRDCTGLTSIEIPSSVTSIDDKAFYNCNGLKSVTIPSGVTSIGESAFQSCTGLTSIEIPIGVTSIGESAFQSCTGLTSIIVSSDNTVYDSRNNCNAIIETASNTLIAGCQNTVIPNSVTSIGRGVFASCTGLTSIEIPSGVTRIGGVAFFGCTSLTSIEIPSGVTSIDDKAFYNCNGLKSVTIPSGVTSIGKDAFYNVKVVIYIGGSATGSPWGAKKVYTTLPDEYGFYYADEEKTQIELYAGTGGDVVIPDGVTSLPNSLFENNKNITSVTIPASVTSIGDWAFYGCTGLTAIYLNSLVPPTTYFYTFYGLDLSNCTLYVPEGFESNYQNANYWKNFTNVAVNPYVTVEKKAVIYVVDGEEYHRDSVVVTTAITAIDAPTREGYTFSGWSEIPATMPDNDVTVTGSFTINTHNIIYVVDGTEYQKVENVAFGTTLAAIDAPTREGYTFSGWSEIPTTMPDNDVTVTGTFTINRYAVIYMVDGVEYSRDSVEYGATITLAENPTRDGYIFSGWSGYPETLVMPAGDVVVTGAFEVNGLAGVAAATSGDEYFDLTGKPLPQPQRGINLVRKADGTTRKIIVR